MTPRGVATAPAPLTVREKSAKAIAKLTNDIAESDAKPAKGIVKSNAKPAKTAANRAYYLQRLEREFPALADKVCSGELSVFRASVAAGLRREPKARKWDANEYARQEADT